MVPVQFLPPSNEVAEGNVFTVMCACVCVSLPTGRADVTITHDAFDLIVGSRTSVLGPSPSSNIWCHRRPVRLNLFVWGLLGVTFGSGH